MPDCPLVSIITIVYNGEKHIADVIRSVGRQNYRNIEYIIVDGGSTDNTLSIIGQFSHIVTAVYSEKDRGISDAFNKGLRRATGEIIGLINADDWYEPDAVEKIVGSIAGFDVAYGDLQFWKDDQPDFIAKGNHRYLRNEMTVNHPTVFIRKECYERFGLFDEKYKCAMDYDLLLRLLIAGCRFVYIPGVLANMRWGGMSDAQWQLGCSESMMIKNKYLPGQRLRHRLYYYKQALAITIPRILRAARLDFIVRIYRSRPAARRPKAPYPPRLIELSEQIRLEGKDPDDIFRYIRNITPGKLIDENKQEQPQTVIVAIDPGPEKQKDLDPQPQEQPGQTIYGKRFRKNVRNTGSVRRIDVGTIKMPEYIHPQHLHLPGTDAEQDTLLHGDLPGNVKGIRRPSPE